MLIRLTKLTGDVIYVNASYILTVEIGSVSIATSMTETEVTGNVTIISVGGTCRAIRESVDEVMELIKLARDSDEMRCLDFTKKVQKEIDKPEWDLGDDHIEPTDY
jgi:uncharacterized protein YlzI (FlbEa/FlbD family)